MDVHAHSHHGTKKWTGYLFDFLMLFLAVSLGFFVENLREKSVEAHRANQYAKTLVSDLVQDTTELQLAIDQTAFIMSSIDSVISIASTINKQGPVPGKFYYFSRFTTNLFIVDWSLSTINQLTQSGSLRYFRHDIARGINNYFAQQGVIANQNHTDWTHRNAIMDLRNRLFPNQYYSVFAPMKVADAVKNITAPLEKDSVLSRLYNSRLPLLDGSEKILDEYLNHIADRKTRLQAIVKEYYPDAKNMAISIIQMLKQKYHLK